MFSVIYNYVNKRYLLWVVIFLLLAISYKYNRQILYQGPQEITYKPSIANHPCNLSVCEKGLVIDLANTGTEIYPTITFHINGIPYSPNIKMEHSIVRFIQPIDIEKISISKKNTAGGVKIDISSIIPGTRILLTIYEDTLEPSTINWDTLDITYKANGSVLQEDPRKVLFLSEVRETVAILVGTLRIKNALKFAL